MKRFTYISLIVLFSFLGFSSYKYKNSSQSETKNKWVEFKKSKSEISEHEILAKIDERIKARDKKDYKLADKIRNELLDKGVLIEDKNDKTSWKLK